MPLHPPVHWEAGRHLFGQRTQLEAVVYAMPTVLPKVARTELQQTDVMQDDVKRGHYNVHRKPHAVDAVARGRQAETPSSAPQATGQRTLSSHPENCQPNPARLLHSRRVVQIGHATGAVKPSAVVTNPSPAVSPVINAISGHRLSTKARVINSHCNSIFKHPR